LTPGETRVPDIFNLSIKDFVASYLSNTG
jgi:hypothetical protein